MIVTEPQTTLQHIDQQIETAMILAAGLGTRLKPWTDHHPKALALVKGKSLLQHNIEYLQQFGIKRVVVNVHHFAGEIINALQQHRNWGSQVIISDETNEVLETGGGLIKAAMHLQQGPFVLMNADILTDLNLHAMMAEHKATNALATLATTNRKTSRYFLFDEEDNLVGWRNVITGEEKINPSKKAHSSNFVQRAFSGVHIIDPLLFGLITQTGKFSMVDVYLKLMSDQTIKSFDHTGSRFIDVGKPESIAKAEELFA